MRAQRLSAWRGWYWIVEGFSLFRQNPALFSFLVLCYFLVVIVLSLVPWLGAPLLSLISTLLNVGIMNACRAQTRGESPQLLILFSAFGPVQDITVRRLLLLGALYFAYWMLALLIVSMVNAGDLLLVGSAWQDKVQIDLIAIGSLLLLMLPALLAWWFAPVLVAWHEQPVSKALFFSLVACLRNWRPFIFYGASLVVWSTLLPLIIIVLLQSIVPDVARFLSGVLMAIVMLVFAPSLFASFYVSYHSIFAQTSDSNA